jgi:hypothetical protein
VCGVVWSLDDFSVIFQYTVGGNSDLVSPKESVEDPGSWGDLVEFLETVINFSLGATST